MTAILHITTAVAWEQAITAGEYKPVGFDGEGFVHCSRLDQIARVADAYYRGTPDLVVLVIDEDRITVPVRYEAATDHAGDGPYPHVYGAIDPAWVVAVQPLLEVVR